MTTTRRTTGRIYAGPQARKAERKAFGTNLASAYGTSACDECGFPVGLRIDNSLRGHHVGTTRKNSWPCPGAQPTSGGKRYPA